MARPFDITFKELLEAYPADWAALLGLGDAGPVTVEDADLSTITAEADKVFRVHAADPWLLHLEPQSSYETQLGRRVHRYNSLLDYRHGLPVQSVVLLLRPEADGPQITGVVRRRRPGGRRYLVFLYEVVRVWELPVDSLLKGGLGTLPLAPISAVAPEALPGVVRAMEARITREARSAETGTLWTATYLLLGLRYPAEFATELLMGVRNMKESTTYQAIKAEGLAEGLAEGKAQGAEKLREALLVLGSKRLGEPDAATRAAIEAVTDLDHLTRLTERLLDVETRAELLADSPA